MMLKELVLISLEALGDFEVDGKTLNQDLFLELADKEIDNYCLNTNEDNQPYITITMKD